MKTTQFDFVISKHEMVKTIDTPRKVSAILQKNKVNWLLVIIAWMQIVNKLAKFFSETQFLA